MFDGCISRDGGTVLVLTALYGFHINFHFVDDVADNVPDPHDIAVISCGTVRPPPFFAGIEQ